MTYALLGLVALVAAALAYSVFANQQTNADNSKLLGLVIAANKDQIEALRNGLAYQQQRDTEKTARVQAEAERDDALARLALAQKQIAANAKESTDAAAESVRTSPTPLDELDRVLASSARDVSSPGHSGASGGGQGAPAV